MISYCFFIEIEIKKANENHINISHEKYKYIDSCFEASDGWTKIDKEFWFVEVPLVALSANKGQI